MRRHGMESRLAVSNLTFPERAKNPNGSRVSLKARLYGDKGELLAESKQIVIPNNGSRELHHRGDVSRFHRANSRALSTWISRCSPRPDRFAPTAS